MTSHAADLQAIYDAARAAATAAPTSANIAAVEKARKALEELATTAAAGEKFDTQAAALAYLQRTWQIERSKLSNDVRAGKVPKKDGFFLSNDLDFYAQAVHLRPRTIEAPLKADPSDRLKEAHAEEREFRLSILKGQYIDAAEEEARDARLWFAIRTDLENNAPVIVNELINRISSLGLPEDIAARILSLAPEMRMVYEDTLADIFDRYAADGGIEA